MDNDHRKKPLNPQLIKFLKVANEYTTKEIPLKNVNGILQIVKDNKRGD